LDVFVRGERHYIAPLTTELKRLMVVGMVDKECWSWCGYLRLSY
jgi:hypothetical protein